MSTFEQKIHLLINYRKSWNTKSELKQNEKFLDSLDRGASNFLCQENFDILINRIHHYNIHDKEMEKYVQRLISLFLDYECEVNESHCNALAIFSGTYLLHVLTFYSHLLCRNINLENSLKEICLHARNYGDSKVSQYTVVRILEICPRIVDGEIFENVCSFYPAEIIQICLGNLNSMTRVSALHLKAILNNRRINDVESIHCLFYKIKSIDRSGVDLLKLSASDFKELNEMQNCVNAHLLRPKLMSLMLSQYQSYLEFICGTSINHHDLVDIVKEEPRMIFNNQCLKNACKNGTNLNLINYLITMDGVYVTKEIVNIFADNIFNGKKSLRQQKIDTLKHLVNHMSSDNHYK